MTILDRIQARLSRKADPPPSPGRLQADAQWEPPSELKQEKQASLYAKLSWIQIAVSKAAQTCAAAPYSVREHRRFEIVGNAFRVLRNHDFLDLLQQPNPTQSRFEFLEATFAWRLLTGNCYWWLNRLDKDSSPIEMWIIPSHKIRPVPDGNMGVRGYLYDYGGSTPMPLEAWEVVHFKTWNPTDRYLGLSPIEALMLDAQGDIGSQKYNANFYSRDNAKSAGILAFKDYIDNDRWKQLRDDWSEQHGGTKNNRVMRLRGVGDGVSWIPTQLSQVEIQYLEQRTFTKEQIYDMFAPGLSSMLSVNATEANSTAGKDTFLSMCVYPQHIAVAEKIDADILPAYGPDLDGEFEDVRRVDTAQELREQEAYERTHTIDEVRAKYYGDKPLAPDARTVTQGPAPAAPIMVPTEESIATAGKMLDRRRWHTKAMKAALAGRALDVAFDPEYLSDDEAMEIRAALKRARTAEDVGTIFKGE